MSAWETFLGNIRAAEADLKFKPGEECFYRGVGDRNWLLEPTLLHYGRKMYPELHARRQQKAYEDKIFKLEYDFYAEFKMRSHSLHAGSITDSWDLLFMMRHHGIPTRLLDWSETLGVSVHFALNELKPDSRPGVWVLNPYMLNEESGNRDLLAPDRIAGFSSIKEDDCTYEEFIYDHGGDFGFDTPLAIYPTHTNPRLRAQGGYFTIHGDDWRPLEISAKKCVRFVEIPAAAISDARQFLARAGISDFSLFPDADGLARFLRKKNGIDPL